MAQWAARGLRRAVADAEWTVAVFWAAGAVVVLVATVSHRWQGPVPVVVWGAAGAAVGMSGLRSLGRGHLPRWTLHLDLALGTLLITGLEIAGQHTDLGFAPLYVWVPLYAALFFPPSSVTAHVAAVAGAYGLTLLVAGARLQYDITSWLEIVVTAGLAGAVVTALVGQLRELALHDPLTGLPNRRAWHHRLELERERAARTGFPLTVAILDLDDFKAINDRGGHAAGDRTLVVAATAWRGAIRRGGDLLARIGGDEFGLLAPGIDAPALDRLTARLVEALPSGLSVCVGSAVWDGRETADALVGRADRVMYEMKQRRPGVHRLPVRTGVGAGFDPPEPGG